MSVRRSLSPLLLALTLAPWAAAQNYVPGGSFDSGTAGWQGTLPYGSIAWNAEDALGSPTSGSAEVSNAQMVPASRASRYSTKRMANKTDALPYANSAG